MAMFLSLKTALVPCDRCSIEWLQDHLARLRKRCYVSAMDMWRPEAGTEGYVRAISDQELK